MNTDATQIEANSPAPRNNRSNNFNALRFLLSASVIFGHSYLLYGAPLREPFTLLTRRQAAAGDLAVDGFFIISGFLILQSWRASKTASDYFRKRVLRIYPGYLVCALLCIFLVGPLGAGAARYFETMPWKESLLGLPFLSLLNLQTFVNSPVPNVNSSLWTISIEFACYIFVAILGLLGASRDRPFTLAAFLDRRSSPRFYSTPSNGFFTGRRILSSRSRLAGGSTTGRVFLLFSSPECFFIYTPTASIIRGAAR